MGYLDTVSLVMNILFTLLGLVMAHFMIFAVVGLFARKKYPETEIKHRYGMIIPARNEEAVVGGLIESIQKNHYPQDKIEIFVIAHNCTDNTAEVARKLGATVYVYDNPDERTMGYAFRHLFSCIERDYGTQSFDGFLLFNADNILDKNYIARMNDAFEYYHGESVITSYRNSKNYGSGLIAGLYGMYFSTGCRFESCGRTVLGCSTRVQGTGYLINSSVVKNGWPYVTLAEDWEFTADQILQGSTIRFCDAAIFYDEQPTSVRIMWRQRVRWSRGHLIVFYTRIKDLLRALFGRGTKHRVSVYDIFSNVIPSTLFFLLLQIVQFGLTLTAPLIDKSLTWQQVLLGDSMNLLWSTGLLFGWLRSMALSFGTIFIGAWLVFFIDRKRVKGVPWWRKLLIALFWPLFLGIQFLMDVQALFSRNLAWKPIPHSDQTSFDHVNADDPADR